MEKVFTASVSKLDSFHKAFHRQTEKNESWNTETNFIATLKGQFKQIESAKYGECFHAIIEGTAKENVIILKNPEGENYGVHGYQWKEVFIPMKQAQHALDYRRAHPLMSHEVPIHKAYKTKFGTLIVTGKLDGLEGLQIRDAKTKYGQVDIQGDYVESYQWRYYLDMLQLDMFYYDVFVVKGYERVSDAPFARITPLEEMYCARYPQMAEDVQGLAHEFMDYITFKGFEDLVSVSPISSVAREYGLYQDMVWTDDTIFTFGKWKGKRLADAPQYLQWLYSNQPLPANLVVYLKSKNLIV